MHDTHRKHDHQHEHKHEHENEHGHGHSHEHSHEHGHEHLHEHEHESATGGQAVSDIAKLRKMVQHWANHNEEHASSYKLWASRAREAGCEGAAEILEEIASEVAGQNERFAKIIDIIDSSGRPE
jgi:hypothetical protein